MNKWLAEGRDRGSIKKKQKEVVSEDENKKVCDNGGRKISEGYCNGGQKESMW